MLKLNIRKNVPLSKLTTFKVGGRAKYFVEIRSEDELLQASEFSEKNSLPIFVLGGGSDILISDEGFLGIVIKFIGKSIKYFERGKSVLVTASSGIFWDDLVKESVERKLQGIECLSGIPGTVGAAPIQNIGAYGQELADVFVKLDAYDFKTGKFVQFDKTDCKFGYRESVFKIPSQKNRFLITRITIKLNRDRASTLTYKSLIDYLETKKITKPSLTQIRMAVLEVRGQKLDNPAVISNVGSFFKNPIVSMKVLQRIQKEHPNIPFHTVNTNSVKLFAGWLIEDTGWKGKKFKNARVSEKNALVITNPKGRATAKELKELADKIGEDVWSKFKIKLEPEVQFIGFR